MYRRYWDRQRNPCAQSHDEARGYNSRDLQHRVQCATAATRNLCCLCRHICSEFQDEEPGPDSRRCSVGRFSAFTKRWRTRTYADKAAHTTAPAATATIRNHQIIRTMPSDIT